MNGLATQVTEELYTGRRQLAELQERGRATVLQKIEKKRYHGDHPDANDLNLAAEGLDGGTGLTEAALAGQEPIGYQHLGEDESGQQSIEEASDVGDEAE